MPYKSTDIVYEQDRYFVLKMPHGFDIYRTCSHGSARCARIGLKDIKEETGLRIAIDECNKWAKSEKI